MHCVKEPKPPEGWAGGPPDVFIDNFLLEVLKIAHYKLAQWYTRSFPPGI
ncbi:hypothetical protein CBL_11920 [Carabus blaptoides fortunei]